MKKFAFVFAILFVAISCQKKLTHDKKDVKYYVYYSEDFKEVDVKINGESSKDLDMVWFKLYYSEDPCKQEEPDRYALVLNKGDEEIVEKGTLESDWYSYIRFTPENGEVYSGELEPSKEVFTITFGDIDRSEELTFHYKK